MTRDLTATIFVVDDDPAVRRALIGVGKLLGLPVQEYSSAREFLEGYDPAKPGCLVLDIKMPDMTGLELQRHLLDKGWAIPIIMISGHATVRLAVEAMSKGALTLLEKPFSMEELLTHLRRALDQDQVQRQERDRQSAQGARLAQLTPREREVLALVAAGKTNKEIAGALQLSIRAVEDRRARLMKKLQVRSVAELVLLTTQV